MNNELKSKLYQLVDSIEDENVLQMIMEEIAYYAGNKDIVDELNVDQLKELNEAISEADDNETIDWEDFKKEMSEWKKKIAVSKRFRKNVLNVYDYLLKEHSAKTAFKFLDKLQQRVELIIQFPEIGKPSQKEPNIRSVTLLPHNRIFYRIKNNTIELLCLFDMRRKNTPY